MSVFKPNYTFSGGQCYLIVTPSKQPLWLWAALFWTSPELLRDTVQPRNGTQAGDMYSVAVLFFNILYRLPSYQTDDFTALVPRGRPIHICFFLSMSIYAIIFRNDSGTFRKVVAQVWDARVETDGVGGGESGFPVDNTRYKEALPALLAGSGWSPPIWPRNLAAVLRDHFRELPRIEPDTWYVGILHRESYLLKRWYTYGSCRDCR